MPKKNELSGGDLTFSLIKEGESTKSFMCNSCSSTEGYILLSSNDSDYKKGFRAKCWGCGLLMKDPKNHNIFSIGWYFKLTKFRELCYFLI